MKNKNGFSLIEFTIYLFSFMLFMQMVCLFISKSAIQLFLIDLKLSRLSAQQMVESLLYEDGIGASLSKDMWLVDTKNQCYIWRTAEKDICWEIKNGDLLRSVGTYHYAQQKWKKRKTSRMLLGVHTLIITPLTTGGHYDIITYTIKYNLLDSEKKNKALLPGQMPLKGRIALKNRVLS